ncbi:MAG: choice-of-anchor J domain-containing protein [Bacteroidales bacterium]
MRKITVLTLMFALIFSVNAQVARKNPATQGNLISAKQAGVEYVSKALNVMRDDVWINYDGENDDVIGTGGAAEFTVLMKIPAADLAAHVGKYLLKMQVYINGPTNSTSVVVYDGFEGNEVYRKAFASVDGWNTININSLAIDGTTDLYFGYEVSVSSGYPAGCDAGPAHENGDYMIFSNEWIRLSTDIEIDANWNIRVQLGDLPTEPIASLSANSLNFGSVILPGSVTKEVKLFNDGAETLTASNITGIEAPFTTTFDADAVSLTNGQDYTFTITYEPTVVGDNNATVQIETNGGTVELSLAGNAVECDEISTFPWIEGFEDPSTLSCWLNVDADGDGHIWELAGEPGHEPHSGSGCIVSSSWHEGQALFPDNYLITPQIDVNVEDLVLKYFVAGQDPDYSDEHYSIMISTADTELSSFTSVFSETLPMYDGSWFERSVSLAEYNGQKVYIAFRHHNSSDVFQIKIDDLEISVATSIEESLQAKINIYPNPANNSFQVRNAENAMVTVVNALGQVVETIDNTQNILTINSANYQSGVYFVKIDNGQEVTVKKVVIK